MNGDRLKIAVFVDFDNIEIGVKSTLNRHFDIGAVLEAIKERGEVVTKVAYGDWKRAGEHSRSMTQHAIQMVQRNLTPGGDKNGADINLALDALEMAFTRNHINAFVIVGGDSDFIALVEKLKQYDKKVMIVGGRAFTSAILQKNCHEFIAYENLIAPQTTPRKHAEKTRTAGESSLAKALPLVRRALKVLSDREVSPQLGLLKSTLLQLDSTFSERDYGASTFRDFIEKMANSGYVNLKQVDRSLLVELKDQDVAAHEHVARETAPVPPPPPSHLPGPAPQSQDAPGPQPAGPNPDQVEEGVRAIQDVFQNAKISPHWPMYLRNVKQFIKNVSPSFDERRYGFSSFLEAVRAAQRAGVLRLERNRQGILRVYAGSQIPQPQRQPESVPEESAPPSPPPPEVQEPIAVEAEPILEAAPAEVIDTTPEPPVSEEQVFEVIPETLEKPARKRRTSTTSVKRKATTRTRATSPKRTGKKATEEENPT
jgi:uncharacterized LabA/DUF88 family protein